MSAELEAKKAYLTARRRGKQITALHKEIIKSPKWAERYARFVVGNRWRRGEAIISTSAEASCYYAEFVLSGPFKKGEVVIKQDASWTATLS